MKAFLWTGKNLVIVTLILYTCLVQGQNTDKELVNSVFGGAVIRWQNQVPKDLRLSEKQHLSETEFFAAYKKAFDPNGTFEFRVLKSIHDKTGMEHKRYHQYYMGVEIAETQYILHFRDGYVRHANGNPVHGLQMSVNPTLSSEQAEFFVKKLFPDYSLNTRTLKKRSRNLPFPDLAQPKLVISRGDKDAMSENYRLVWRFDIFNTRSLKRYLADMDAHSGELHGLLPASFDDDVPTRGVSYYNDTVDIVVVDENFQDNWDHSSWHLNDWNAYGGSGESWWIADTLLGEAGGYRDGWYQALVTDPVTLTGQDPELNFYHRYSTELPQIYEEYNAWDGMNVQISTDGGANWEVLTNPTPAYDRSSLYSFGYHGEGPKVPGWCGNHPGWEEVTFSLSSYSGSTVQIRFAFASDGAYSSIDEPGLFGWQVDNISISGLYQNDGDTSNIRTLVITSGYVRFIEGNYRLRETTRGQGIASFNGEEAAEFFSNATDFVEEDSLFSEPENKVGVSLLWGVEKTYDYYLETFDRHGYDDLDGLIRSYANMEFDGGNPNNAAYLGGGYMIYGRGDGAIYGPWVSINTIGHELTHGVTASSANLVYQNESGALNESFSDIFGMAVELYTLGKLDNWGIGDIASVNDLPFRSMSDPNSYRDPDTYLGNFWVEPDGDDNGGVHTNSGVMNHWFYLLCTGGTGTNDDDFEYDVTPIDFMDAEQIAYRNLTAYLVPGSEYADAAYYSIQSAIDLFGEGSRQVISVQEAWEAVGVYIAPKIIVAASLNLESTVPGQTVTRTLVIENKSINTLILSDLSLSGQGFGFASEPTLPLSVYKNTNLDISYTPVVSSPETGILTITSNDPDNPVVVVNLNGSGFTDLNQSPDLGSFGLGPVYPNPFRENTLINFSLASPSDVQLKILNAQGELVKNLVEGSYPAGSYSVEWNGTNAEEATAPRGSYIILLTTGEQQAGKMITVY